MMIIDIHQMLRRNPQNSAITVASAFIMESTVYRFVNPLEIENKNIQSELNSYVAEHHLTEKERDECMISFGNTVNAIKIFTISTSLSIQMLKLSLMNADTLELCGSEFNRNMRRVNEIDVGKISSNAPSYLQNVLDRAQQLFLRICRLIAGMSRPEMPTCAPRHA